MKGKPWSVEEERELKKRRLLKLIEEHKPLNVVAEL